MELRVLARLYDRSEALVMSSCLDAAGVPHWVFGAEMININPLHEVAYDGYKIVLSECDLEPALAVIREAIANPAPCDEHLVIRHLPVTFAIFHLAQLMLAGLFLWVPMRQYRWVPRTADVR